MDCFQTVPERKIYILDFTLLGGALRFFLAEREVANSRSVHDGVGRRAKRLDGGRNCD